MGKHNKPHRSNRYGQIAVAAAAASVIGGWAAPVAYADNGAGADNAKPSNPVSKAVGAAAGAARDTVDGVRKAVTGAADSFQKAAQSGLQVGSGGAGTSRSLIPRPSSIVRARTNGGSQRDAAVAIASPPPAFDTPSGSVTIPIVDVTLPGLPDGPRFALPTPSPGIPPGFGSQGSNTLLGGLTNGNNLFGGNFFNIGDDNLLTANNIGTGLQGIIAGDDNFLAGNQVIAPTSSGTNFGWMGDDNGEFDVNPPDLEDLLSLDVASLANFLTLEPSGNNIVGSPFSYGNNTFIMGDDNDGSANNIILGAGNFGNNMHFIGDNADFSGNNLVAGLGSFGNNMSVVGDSSELSGNNSALGVGAFANNIGLIGSAASGSGNNSNTSAFGFAQNFVLVGDSADGSGNNTHVSPFWGYAQNIALIGSGANGSGNNNGIFNFALVGSGVQGAGNNANGFNVAILPGSGEGNCTGPACFSIFGAQIGT